MSRSEFRWNKKRKHYAYLYKDRKTKCWNILITSKSIMILKKNKKENRIIKNIPLYHHPNSIKEGNYFVIPKNYLDEMIVFDEHIYKTWKWNKHDKRKIKRIKRKKSR